MRLSTVVLGLLVFLDLVPGPVCCNQAFGDDEVIKDIPPISEALFFIQGIAADPKGGVYLSNNRHNIIVRLDSDGTITRIAGTGTFGYSGDNGPAASAQLAHPWGIAIDSDGDLYIADLMHDCIRKVSGGVITTVTGNGTSGFSGDEGPAVNAQISQPVSVHVDSAGNLYIADHGNRRIRKVSNGVITSLPVKKYWSMGFISNQFPTS